MQANKARSLANVKTLADLLVKGISASNWYPMARESIKAYANANGFTPGLVADALALASPRRTVADSVRIARHWLETGAMDGGKIIDVTGAVRKQWERYIESGGKVINGPKCSAFAAALRGDDNALVVDSWIMAALKAPLASTGRQWVLQAASRRFKALADITGLPVASCQAAVWSGIQGGKCAWLTMGAA